MRKKYYEGCLVLIGKLCLCKVFINMSFILDNEETCLITNLTLVGRTYRSGGVSSMNVG